MPEPMTEYERKTIGMGAAKPQTVIAYYQDALENFPELVHDLQSLRVAVDAMMVDDSGKRILTAIACSVLNLQFERLPVLYMVDDDGEYGTVVYENDKMALGIQLGMLSR